MKITILGCGSAYGLPMAGNYNKFCDLSNEKNIRLRPSFYLEDGKDKLLVECGPDFRQQTNQYNITNVDNIFVSHAHADHIMGIWELTNWVKLRKNIINIYGDEDTIRIIKERFPFMFEKNFKELGEGQIILNVISDRKPFTPKQTSMEITPLKYIHKSEYSFGFRYKNFVFTSDLEYIPNASEKYLDNLDLWILESNNLEGSLNGHNYIARAVEWAKKYKPKRTILNHLNATIDYDKITKTLPDGVELVYDGMVLEV